MVVTLYTHVLSVNTLFPDTFSFDITQPCMGYSYTSIQKVVYIEQLDTLRD